MKSSEKDVFDLQARLCSVFSNPARLRILDEIGHGERTTAELAEALGTGAPAISQHLGVMKDRGALDARRQGRSVLYRVSNTKILAAAALIREALLEEMRKAGSRAKAARKERTS